MIRSMPARGLAAALFAILLAACASTPWRSASEDPPPFRDPAMTMPLASSAIVIGTSSRTQVIAALGEGTAVRFDSGYEIRLYRDRRTDDKVSPAELVVLFSPAGIAQKVRVKPAYRLPSP